jgi:hypothetical protein
MRFGAMTQTSMRGFAGGSSQPAIDPKCTDFDIVFVGGINAAAVLKFTQQNDIAKDAHLKMAIVSQQTGYIQPQAYFGVAASVLPGLKLESGSLSA